MTIVVGFAPAKGDLAAVHLAATLARSAGEKVVAVVATPAPWPTPVARGADREFTAWAQESGEKSVAAATAALADVCPDLESEAVSVSARSTAAALLAAADEHQARMIVVGSGSDGSFGTVVVSSVADRLLHSAPVPVAIATRGYRAAPHAKVPRVTCAFRGDDDSEHVLARTATVAAAVGATLRIATFGVGGRTMYPPEVMGEQDVLDAYVESTAARQAKAAEHLDDVDETLVETAVGTGRSWAEALDALHWLKDEVLVVGSSSEGTIARLFLGSRATKIIRHSPVPVVMVP